MYTTKKKLFGATAKFTNMREKIDFLFRQLFPKPSAHLAGAREMYSSGYESITQR